MLGLLKAIHRRLTNGGVKAMGLQLLDEKQAAKRIGVKVQTLRNWRHLRKGLPYVKLGERAIRYIDSDCDEFVLKNSIDPNN
jgi:hypothetical protein